MASGTVQRTSQWLLLLLLLTAAIFVHYSNAQSLEIGFGEIDYTRREDANVPIQVVKRGTNTAPLFVTVSPLTFDQFSSRSFVVPSEITDIPDPAEFEPFGRMDFDNTTIEVVFQPSTINEEQVQTVILLEDNFNEDVEGFFIVVQVDATRSSPTDVSNTELVRNGVALVRITDNDNIQLSFGQSQYMVGEGDGVVDDVVFVTTGGMISEQVLSFIIQFSNSIAISGEDFVSAVLSLTIQPSQLAAAIPVEILDDAILESTETFSLTLTIPGNPPNGVTPGLSQTTVFIQDNEIATLGFVQTEYTVFEGIDSSVQVTVNLSNPMSNDDISLFFSVLFGIVVFEDTATGCDERVEDCTSNVVDDYIVRSSFPVRGFADIFARQMVFTVDIFDDTTVEATEEFILQLTPPPFPDPPPINTVFSPIQATVFIMDNDGVTVLTIDPSPTIQGIEGNSITVDCAPLDGVNVITIRVNNAEQPLPFQDIGATRTYTFGPIDRTDEGTTFQCFSSSGLQTDITTLTVFFSPQYTVNDTFTQIEGNSFRVELGLTGNPLLGPQGSFDWSFNGRLLTLPSGDLALGVNFINFGIVDRAEAGTYSVSATNVAGTGTASFELIVFFGPQYTVNDTFTVIEGDSFRVDLALTGNPLPGAPGTFQWFFNGQPLSQSGDLLLGVNSIDFGTANRAEAGTYSVSATNVAGTGTASFELIVFFGPEYTVNDTFTVIEGDSFRVDLGLTGNPLPGAPGTFQWFFNGQPLSQTGDLLLGVNSIDFGTANRAEAGTYSVSATNVAGTGTASFELIVFFGPEYTVNDTFTVIEGDSFRVDLGLTGNPLPGAPGTFQWFFNGQPLSQSGDLLLGVNSIDFGTANRAEAGTYSVSATNVAGTGTASFELMVFYQPVYIVNDTFTFTEGDRVRIELQLDANPLPIIFEWFFNGLPLPLMPGLDLGRDVIDISIATILDTGNYTVTSTNAAGSGSGNFMLVIERSVIITSSVVPGPSPTVVPSLSPTQTTTQSTLPPPTASTVTPTPSVTPTQATGLGGDPHYSIHLPSGQMLCFSVHGEPGFSFNLISNKWLQMNAHFVQDSVREEITWIESLGVVVTNRKANTTKLRFEAEDKMIYVGEKMELQVQNVEKLTLLKGKLTISEVLRDKKNKKPEVVIDLKDYGLTFTVRFAKAHLDLIWNHIKKQPTDSHGIIGQFFQNGVEIDEPRRLLLLPALSEPVSVMRKPVWHFMEREVADDQLCWVAMNPGYQGKKLIQGHYLDYLVNDVLSTGFKFKPTKRRNTL